MTRYIDVDMCIAKIKDMPVTYDSETVQRCIEVLSNAPTIDAIPVSYIEKQIEGNNGLAFEIRANGNYHLANSISQYAAQIELFLEDWYEENDKTD